MRTAIRLNANLRKTVRDLLLATSFMAPAGLQAATNLDVPIELNAAHYRALAENRQHANQEADALEGGLSETKRLWEKLNTTTKRDRRVEIIRALAEQLEVERNKARSFQKRQDSIRIQALKTIDKSGTRTVEDVTPADYAKFTNIAKQLGDQVFSGLNTQARTALGNLVATNRMLATLRETRRHTATSNVRGITSPRDLVRVAEGAELAMLAGLTIERLMDAMLGGLRDLIVAEQEGELSTDSIRNTRSTLQDATNAARTALERTRQPASGKPGDTLADANPYRNVIK